MNSQLWYVILSVSLVQNVPGVVINIFFPCSVSYFEYMDILQYGFIIFSHIIEFWQENIMLIVNFLSFGTLYHSACHILYMSPGAYSFRITVSSWWIENFIILKHLLILNQHYFLKFPFISSWNTAKFSLFRVAFL